VENGPCQPCTLDFPMANLRRFVPEWFDEFGDWLEYSESKDKAYCFCCFLFREKDGRKERLRSHVGDVGGLHYRAMKKCNDLLQTNQHIDVAFYWVSESSKRDYFTRLNGSIDVARILAK
jgi:hypothetical protein